MSDERPETPAEQVAADLGHAAGRSLAIGGIRERIDECDLTRLERYELALAILNDLNYEAPMEWERESSYVVGDEDEGRVRRCPECEHRGSFDGQGRETDSFERYSSDLCGWEKVKEIYYKFHCGECDCVFQVREREIVDEAE